MFERTERTERDSMRNNTPPTVVVYYYHNGWLRDYLTPNIFIYLEDFTLRNHVRSVSIVSTRAK